MHNFNLDELRNVAFACADAAQAETLRHFRKSDIGLTNKANDHFDPVTIADRDAEAAIRKILGQLRPDDAILGEEQGHTKGKSGLTWVIDPIDGTRGYMSGTPTWGTLIAATYDGHPIFGMIDQPYIGERFWGGGGQAEMVRGSSATRLQVNPDPSLDTATLFSTYPEIGTGVERSKFERVAEKVRLVRFGTDCYAYALLAAGQIDLVIEAGLNSYDIQGPIGVIEGAGGIVTNWDGGSAAEGGRVIAAASQRLHQETLELLNAD